MDATVLMLLILVWIAINVVVVGFILVATRDRKARAARRSEPRHFG